MLPRFSLVLKNALFQLVFFTLLSALLYTSATTFIYRDRLPTLSTHYAMPDVDTDGGLWYQWYLFHTQSENKIYDVTDIMSYPLGYDVAFSPVDNLIYTLQSRILLHNGSFDLHQLILITNISTLLTYPSLATLCFVLAWIVTKKFWPSFLAGWMAAFSFYFILMGRGQMSINHTWIVVLFLIPFLLYLKTTRFVWGFLSMVILGLMFQTDAYYAFFSGIFSVVLFLTFQREPVSMKLRRMLVYYSLAFFILFLLNINFIVNNLYQFDTSVRAQTGRDSTASIELVPARTYFSVFHNTWLYQKIGSTAHLFVASLIAFGLSGLVIVKRHRRAYLAFSLCFLVCVALSAQTHYFSWMNDIYFRFFGMFRGVGRLNVFAMMFLGLMSAVVYSELLDRRSISLLVRAIPCLMLCTVYLLANYPQDETWTRKTSIVSLEELYAPLRDDPNVTAIASYPMTLGAITYGFPSTYQLIGQLVHQKPLASGVSPFEWETQVQYQKISDPFNPQTIETLERSGINTIVIYNVMQPNREQLHEQLVQDSRVRFLGRHTSSSDEGYISTVDLSKDISIYRLVNVAVPNTDGEKIQVTKGAISLLEAESPYHYTFSTSGDVTSNDALTLKLPYSTQWKIYAGHASTVFPFLSQRPLLTANHYRNPTTGFNEWRGEIPAGDYSLVFSRSFTKYLSQLVFWMTLSACTLVLLGLVIKGVYER